MKCHPERSRGTCCLPVSAQIQVATQNPPHHFSSVHTRPIVRLGPQYMSATSIAIHQRPNPDPPRRSRPVPHPATRPQRPPALPLVRPRNPRQAPPHLLLRLLCPPVASPHGPRLPPRSGLQPRPRHLRRLPGRYHRHLRCPQARPRAPPAPLALASTA